MITSYVLSLREGLEAALIIGIVLGALRKSNRPDLNRSIWAGVLSATLLSLLAGFGLRLLGQELEGPAEPIYEGVTLLLAAGVLTWMIFWMSRQSKKMKSQLENSVFQATNLGGKPALFFLAFIAVFREGIELVLYLTAAAMASTGGQTLLGTLVGLLTAGLLGYLIYTASIRLNLARFFQVTGFVLILFAAGLVTQSIAEFNEAGIIPAIINPIWNLNPYLSDQSALGVVLNTLFGYHGSPSLTMALGYIAYMVVIVWFFLRSRNIIPPVTPRASATSPTP